MEEEQYKKAFWILVILIVVAGLASMLYYIFVYKPSQEIPATPPVTREEQQSAPFPTEEPIIEEVEKLPELEGITLDESDEIVAQLVKKLSAHPQLVAWAANKDLIRKFTVVIDNIVGNYNPRKHVKFMKPKGEFQVLVKDGNIYLNPESYIRYDPITEVFASLDTKGITELYRQLKPLIQEAYKELGYPNQNFDEALFTAINILLKTPLVENDIQLEKKVIRYKMVDKKLENLTPAQKQLLRMGPKNVRKIQTKLREIVRALGMPESQIPQSSVYLPKE